MCSTTVSTSLLYYSALGIQHSISSDSEGTHTSTVPILMAIPTTYPVLFPPTIPVTPSESTIDTSSSTSNVSTVSSLPNPPSEIVTRQASEDSEFHSTSYSS